MKVNILYHSKFGNNQTIAEELAIILKKRGHEAAASGFATINLKEPESTDLYVFCSPTHIGNAPFKTRHYLKRLRVGEGTKYALLMTHVESQKQSPKTLSTMEKFLTKKGAKKVGESEIIVKDFRGPLEDNYRIKLEEFASKITK